MPRRRQPDPGEQLQLGLPEVKKVRRQSVTGTTLNRWIVQHLQMHGCLAWRQNVGGAVYEDAESGRRQFVQFGEKGQSDVMGVVPPDGRYIAVEGKVEDDLTPEQEAFLERVRRMGGIALVVRPDDYQDLIDDALGIPVEKRWRKGK